MKKTSHVQETIDLNNNIYGFLFEPANLFKTGAVIVLHERYGMSQHTQDLAKRFADEGYVAMAPDLYCDLDVDHEALANGEIGVHIPDQEAEEKIGRCIDYLKTLEKVDTSKIIVIGVCQTGRFSIVAGSHRNDIAASIVLYGAASEVNWEVNEKQPTPLEDIVKENDVPHLLIYAEGDHSIPLSGVLRMRNALESANNSYRLRIFPKVPHGFLNDTMPPRYRHEEAKEAWSEIVCFIDEVFDQQWPQERTRWEFESEISKQYDFTKNKRYG